MWLSSSHAFWEGEQVSQTETHPHFPKPLVFGRWCLGLTIVFLLLAAWNTHLSRKGSVEACMLPSSSIAATFQLSHIKRQQRPMGQFMLWRYMSLPVKLTEWWPLAPGAPFQCPHTGMSNSATGDSSGLQSGLQLLLQKTGGLLQVPYGICKLCAW